MSYIEASQALYNSRLQPHFGPPTGCSPSTIAQLERQFACPFPAAYREFLLWLGEHREGPFVGSDCFPEHLARNNEWLPELLAENRIQFPLPPHFLTFFLHQGYLGVWFALPAPSDDPPVWIFNEASTPQFEQRPHFSEWLLEFMSEAAGMVEQRVN
jgi:hypothetical protein